MSQYDRSFEKTHPTHDSDESDLDSGYTGDAVCPWCFLGGSKVEGNEADELRFNCTTDGCGIDVFAIRDGEKVVVAP